MTPVEVAAAGALTVAASALASLAAARWSGRRARAQTVDTLSRQTDLLGRVLETMREGVLVAGPDGRVAVLNPALREMLLTGSGSKGAPWDQVIGAPLRDTLARAAGGEAVSEEVELGGLKPRRLLVNAAPLSGEPGSLLAVVVDVTEVRRLETVRRDFVANVSHELRTPVAAVVAATETLRGVMARDPAAAQEFVEMIDRNAQRLHRLVADLLDLSRIESREFRLDVQPVRLEQAARHVLTLAQPRAAAKHIHLKVEVPPTLDQVDADPRALDQILTNLVENAIKYCPDSATLTIGAELDGALVRVLVRDTGGGIDARHLPRLFERFYRVDASRARDAGGMGLGLSIVKHLVEAMGGSVAVESTLGQGTTFSFTLARTR